ncbi:MAG: hypothetical protein IPL38_09255 [Rhodobacter sp.]|nr:hypothetical protein [Rhodobacter sp.]
MAAEMAITCAGVRKGALAVGIPPAARTENTQPRKLTGIVSTGCRRSATVKAAKPKAEASAARLPDSAPAASPSRTMMNMPAPASDGGPGRRAHDFTQDQPAQQRGP